MPKVYVKQYDTTVNFPDTMSEEEIKTVLRRKFSGQSVAEPMASTGLRDMYPQTLPQAWWGAAKKEATRFPRTWDIFWEEAKGGYQDILGAAKEEIEVGRRQIQETMATRAKRLGRAVSGGFRTVWSPVTAVTRAFGAEPIEEDLATLGASPTVQKIGGTVMELAPQIATPMATPKGFGLAQRIMYGPRVAVKAERLAPEAEAIFTRITEGVKKYKVLRKEQEVLYTASRGPRLAKMESLSQQMKQGKITPTEMLNKKLAVQKGPLGKVSQAEIDDIARTFQEGDLDFIIRHIDDAPNLNSWEKMATQSIFRDAILGKFIGYSETGVVKIGERTLPINSAIDLLAKTLPREFVDTLIENQSALRRAAHLGIEVLNMPRAMLSSGDLSFGFRQAIFAAPRHPIKFTKAMGAQFKYAFSERSFQKLMARIKADPITPILERDAKIAFTDLGGMTAEERFIGESLAEKIPFIGRMIRGSSRAYTGGLNKFRFDIAKDFLTRHPEVFKEAKGLQSLGAFVNSATGRGNLPQKLSGALNFFNAVLFSPRLAMSRINTINPIWYMKLSPTVRKEAIKTGITFYGTAISALTLLGIGLKKHGFEVGTDPTSADFGKLKRGNMRIDLLGGYQQYFRLFGQLLYNKMTSTTTGREYVLGEGYRATTPIDIIYRFIESKENPIVSFVTQMWKGKSFTGQPFDWLAETNKRLIPMVWQDAYDLYKEGGMEEVPWAIPAVFGVGLQTYGRQIPTVKPSIEIRGGRIQLAPKLQLMPMPDIGEDIANMIRGKKPTLFPEESWRPLEKVLGAEQKIKWTKQDINKAIRSPIDKKVNKAFEEALKE